MRRAALALVLLGLPSTLASCSTEELEDKAKQAGDKAKQAGAEALEKAEELGEQAGEKSKALAEQAGEKSKALAGKAKDGVEGWWSGEAPSSGELSDRAKTMLDAALPENGVEAALARGTQLAPVALEIGKAVHEAIDSDTKIEPIIQKVDDQDAQAELDAKISGMPRVETIEGVSVGFKDMTQYDSGGRTSESAYLVLWRKDDRLLGFVYHSRQRISIDTLIADAPRLIKLVQGAL
jgi:hypothetical protein